MEVVSFQNEIETIPAGWSAKMKVTEWKWVHSQKWKRK